MRTLPLLVALIVVAGCGGRLARAHHALDEGRAADAVEEFRALEPEIEHLSPRAQARYALYRGLAHLACGDLRPATRWLSRARAAGAADPTVFDAGEHGRLDAAWRGMGLMPGEAAPITSGLPADVPGHSEPPHASR